MAIDVAPEILEEIEKNFEEYYADPNVKRIYKKIADGTATYSDMQILSSLVAKYVYQSIEKAYTEALGAGKLPDDTLYENIVEKTMRPPLKDGHGIITEACGYVQTDLNRKSGIKLNAVEPEINEDRISGLIYHVTNTNETKLSKTVTAGLVDTFFRSIVDDYVHVNLDFQKESGLNPQISRTRGPNSNSRCKYCAALVYTGDYKGPSMPAEIFRRHRYCHCNVLYNPMNGGKLQDVWAKREYQDYREAEQKQRQYLNELDQMTPGERKLARNARERELRRAKYSPKEWLRREKLEQPIKERKNTSRSGILYGDNFSSMLNPKAGPLPLKQRKAYKGLDVRGIIKQDVTLQYLKAATPRVGIIIAEKGYKTSKHKDEVTFSEWIFDRFGGSIKMLLEANKKGIQNELTPDYLWNGKLWDLKTTSSLSGLEKRMRKGFLQIEKNPGGIFIDYTGNESVEEIVRKINAKKHYKEYSEPVDIMVVRDKRILVTIRV